MKKDEKDIPGVIWPPPLTYVLALIISLLLQWVAPFSIPWNELRLPLGLVTAGVGIFLIGWSVRTFRRAGTSENISTPTSKIVVTGPYRFTRNPMYVSLSLIYVGIAMALNSSWALLLLPFVILVTHYGVIVREERYLERRFGEDYLRYRRTVRRWI